jgi:hypothetical protein
VLFPCERVRFVGLFRYFFFIERRRNCTNSEKNVYVHTTSHNIITVENMHIRTEHSKLWYPNHSVYKIMWKGGGRAQTLFNHWYWAPLPKLSYAKQSISSRPHFAKLKHIEKLYSVYCLSMQYCMLQLSILHLKVVKILLNLWSKRICTFLTEHIRENDLEHSLRGRILPLIFFLLTHTFFIKEWYFVFLQNSGLLSGEIRSKCEIKKILAIYS